MVGNPGSSARCLQCRQRKKKCDLERPACTRCIRSGLQCSGPLDTTVFIHRNADNLVKQTDKAALTAAFGARAKQQDTAGAGIGQKPTPLARRQTVYDTSSPITTELTDSVVITSSARMLYESIAAEFSPDIELGIFGGDRLHGDKDKRIYSTIARCTRTLIPLTSMSGRLLDLGIFSLITKYYAYMRGNQQLLSLAQSSYTSALGRFHRHLGGFPAATGVVHSNFASCQIVLYLCLAMQYFEVTEWSSSTVGTEIHIDGATSLLQMTQPEWYRTPRLRSTLSCFRGMVIQLSLRRRRRTFLAEQAWREIPFHGTSLTPLEQLHDSVVQLPTLIERADQLLASLSIHRRHSQHDHQRQRHHQPLHHDWLALLDELIFDYKTLKQALETWYAEFTLTQMEPLYWASDGRPLNHKANDSPPPFDDVMFCHPLGWDRTCSITFRNGATAGLLAHYWAYSLELLAGLIELHQRTLASDDSFSLSGEREMNYRQHVCEWIGQADHLTQLITEAIKWLSSCLEGCVVSQAPNEIVVRYRHRMEQMQDRGHFDHDTVILPLVAGGELQI